MNIEVQVKGGKNWFAKAVGTSEKYGLKVEFMEPTRKVSHKLRCYTITEPGIYKHEPRAADCLSIRRDTGFLRVDADGTVTEISREEAIAADEFRARCDAFLIGAAVSAPDMLAALTRLLHTAAGLDQSATHDGLANCDAIAQARAAIAKAKGGAQ